MPSIGHGISDAVRNHIPTWIDNGLADVLYEKYRKANGIISRGYTKDSFRSVIRNSTTWVRKSRKTTRSGFERLYLCKNIPDATLIVHSPEDDMSANAYVFHIDGEPIAGGKTKLKSTHVSTKISTKDKTSIEPMEITFIKFTKEELRAMKTQMDHGDGFDHLEVEREA